MNFKPLAKTPLVAWEFQRGGKSAEAFANENGGVYVYAASEKHYVRLGDHWTSPTNKWRVTHYDKLDDSSVWQSDTFQGESLTHPQYGYMKFVGIIADEKPALLGSHTKPSNILEWWNQAAHTQAPAARQVDEDVREFRGGYSQVSMFERSSDAIAMKADARAEQSWLSQYAQTNPQAQRVYKAYDPSKLDGQNQKLVIYVVSSENLTGLARIKIEERELVLEVFHIGFLQT